MQAVTTEARPDGSLRRWSPGNSPVAVVMITLNEAHNMRAALEGLRGWAQEVFVVDSFSRDDTVGIALEYGVHVVQRRFRGFGDQWNFALRSLPIRAPWTMKLDPDERLSGELRMNLSAAMSLGSSDGFSMDRRLWFMGRPMSVKQGLLRVWRTGQCRFSDVTINEHPLLDGQVQHVSGDLEHHDSPDLDHWLEKQNRYTTAEAGTIREGRKLAAEPKLFGSALERRMWLKHHYRWVPFRHFAFFFYSYLVQGAWRAGWVGYVWSRLRADVMRLIEYKTREMELTGLVPHARVYGSGQPDPRVRQYD